MVKGCGVGGLLDVEHGGQRLQGWSPPIAYMSRTNAPGLSGLTGTDFSRASWSRDHTLNVPARAGAGVGAVVGERTQRGRAAGIVEEVLVCDHCGDAEVLWRRGRAAGGGSCERSLWWCYGGAVEVLWRWRCYGGAVEVLWRCCGGAVEVLWRWRWRCMQRTVTGGGDDSRSRWQGQHTCNHLAVAVTCLCVGGGGG